MPPSSTRDQHDQQPLLAQDDNHEPDSRFAIDEETAAQHADNQDQATDDVAPKYPPLPPSYDDTLRLDAQSSSRWNISSWFTLSRTTREHIQACMPRQRYDDYGEPISFSSRYRKLCRFCPTSRFAQASMFVFGLWLLVIFTGPALYDVPGSSGNAVLHQNWDYSDIPTTRPSPLKGDGHIVQEAAWTSSGCAPQSGNPDRTICTESTSFLLDPNKSKDSFKSTDSIFLDVDPLRPNRPEPAGSVPGLIKFVHETSEDNRDGSDKGKVSVDVAVKYDQDYKFLFERSLVAKTKRGSFDEGVEILTYAKAGSIETSPLVIDVTVRIPKGINVPTMACDAGASNIEAIFSDNTQSRRALSSKLGSKRSPKSKLVRASPDEGFYGFYFGKFHARTQVGHLSAATMRALAEIHLTTVNGNIQVDGRLFAPRVELRSSNGHITVGPGSSVESDEEILLQTQNGRILIEKEATIKGTTVRTVTSNGDIFGTPGLFYANHSLSFRTDNGRIEADVAVQRPDLGKLDAPGIQKTETVSVEATSVTGVVKLHYTKHEPGVVLNSKALSELSRVEVKHHPEFQGAWDLRGATHSRIRGSGAKDGVKDGARTRRFAVDQDNYGWINRHVQGRIWWEQDGSSDKLPGDAETRVNSQLGLAVLNFR